MTDGDEKVSNLPNLSTFKLKKGQTYTVDEIIQQMTLASSNPATLILGRTIDGDTSQFTDHMNEKAKRLGMTHTHFTNPSVHRMNY
ncbi:penicillin binding protein 4 [Staphylococcus caprae]|nr:penicillin binding protein 4 [Staphylococcus caprae]